MAACSEQEIDGKLSTDFCSNFPVPPVPIQNSELFVKNSRTSERILSEKVSNNESPDLSQLSDEQFEDILKELAQCKSAARSSSLVRCLRRGVRDQEEAPPSLHGAPHRSLQDLPQCMRVAGSASRGTARTVGPAPRLGEVEAPEGDARPALNNGTVHQDDLESIAVDHLESKTFFIESDMVSMTTRMAGRAEAVRKGKKGRNHTEETVKLAKHIEGNRGDDSIDTLVAFICSEDKRRAAKGPNGLDRKLKTPQRRARHPPRERCGEGEEEEEKERPFSPSFYSDQGAEPEESVGRLDVSSYSDVDQVQEEFRLVTKKQRRRGQLKEAASRRPPLGPVPPPAPTRSVPPSEPSSPDNSDLDSVHDLPVGGRSQGDAPTSYADIARMSCRARRSPAERGAPPRPAVATPATVFSPVEVPRSTEIANSPAVVLLDDVSSLPAPLGQITFGFDVNEQLVRMTLDGQLCCVPSTTEDRDEPVDSLGSFNYTDVVDFMDSAWTRAFQSYKRDSSAAGESPDRSTRSIRYYCDASTPARLNS